MAFNLKDEVQFHETLTETLQVPNRVFVESLQRISQSVTDLGNNICRSMRKLTQGMIMQSQPQH